MADQKQDIPEHLSVLVVGGGVAGLHTALRLVEAGEQSIKVFEGRGGVGGRIKTTRDETGKPLFNDFAWRIGETNTHMLALVKELGVEIREQFTPPAKDEPKEEKGSHSFGLNVIGSHCDGGGDTCHADSHETPAGRAPLSTYATHCLASTNGADEQDRESGYAGRTAQISFPGESHGTVNHIVVNGMNEIPNKLAAKLPEGVLNVHSRARDVKKLEDGRYQVDISIRTPGAETFKFVSFTCDTLVLAAPPVSLRGFSIAKEGLGPVLFAVHQRRLAHCYAWSKSDNVPDRSDVEDRIYKGFPDSILQQVVSGDYGNGTFQAAYACDRFERVWRELQFQGPEVVKAEVVKQLAKIELPRLKGVEIDKVQVCSGFVHRWQLEAHLNGKTKEELQAQAVYPSPVRLPRLHLVGEAFSSQQGWTEGALITSMAAVEHILKNPTKSASKHAQPMAPPAAREKGGNQMVFKGLVINVSQWRSRHPGGAGQIFGHGNEDISELFQNFHGGWPAPLATLFGLQSGVADK